MNWQPIDTAPKDGTWVLLTGGRCYFSPEPPAVTGFYLTDTCLDLEYWAIAYYDSDWRSQYRSPTHWMPLPERP